MTEANNRWQLLLAGQDHNLNCPALVEESHSHGRLSSLGRCQSPCDRPLRFTEPQEQSWPHPATYVIDKQGIVHWKFVEVDYKVRATNDMILQTLRLSRRTSGGD